MDRKEDLEATGDRVRDLILRDPRAGDEIRRGRSVFLEEVDRRNAPSGLPRGAKRRWLPIAVAASVAAGAAAFLVFTRPVTFQIGEARPGQLGSVIEAADGRIVPVSF